MSNNNEIDLKQLLVDYPILSEQFTRADSTLTKTLFREVDESSFALADWLESLVVLFRWLDENGLSLSHENCLGYVSCAVKSVGNNSALIHLPSLVQEFLEQYGCELAVKK